MSELLIVIRSHHFVVTRITPRGRTAVESFAKKFVQYGMQRSSNNRYIHSALKVYAAATQDRSEYRFHIHQLKQFQQHLEAYYLRDDLVEYDVLLPPEPAKVTLSLQSHWKSHDYQVPVIEYLKNEGPPLLKLAELQTGKGKSMCAMSAMSDIGHRTVIIVKPMYLEKWVEDIRRTYDIAIEDLMVIRGSSQLMALLLMGEAGSITSKIILISNKTIQNWIKLYERYKDETLDMGYVCTPDRLCEVLGAGIRLIDEVHQDFHLNYKIDLYTNVKHSISLSATLLSEDDFMNKMYEIAYPAATRYKGDAYDKYIATTAVIYKVKHPNKIRFKDPASKNYSHHVFEQSIMRSSELCSNYLKLIKQIIDGSYLRDYKKGQRLIIFCASIDMCTLATDYLKKAYKTMDVRRYVEEDSYEDLMEADIRVTTLQSAGTAVDIPELTTAILTTAVSSIQANVQSFGRLRKLKDGTTPEFLYLVCEDVSKHIEYHERKRVMLKDRALNYKSVFIPTPI